jgi:hypothetical protein
MLIAAAIVRNRRRGLAQRRQGAKFQAGEGPETRSELGAKRANRMKPLGAFTPSREL